MCKGNNTAKLLMKKDKINVMSGPFVYTYSKCFRISISSRNIITMYTHSNNAYIYSVFP